MNTFQSKDKILFYKGSHAYVTDPSFKLLGKYNLKYDVTSGEAFEFEYRNPMFSPVVVCRSRLFALLQNVLVQLDGLTVKELQTVPSLSQPGFARCVSLGDSLIVTNERQFFEFDFSSNAFREVRFSCGGSFIESEDTCLLQFQSRVVLKTKKQDSCSVFQVYPDLSARLLYNGARADVCMMAGGICGFVIDQQVDFVYIDMTQQEMKAEYCFDAQILREADFALGQNGVELCDATVEMLMDLKQFKERRQAAYAEFS